MFAPTTHTTTTERTVLHQRRWDRRLQEPLQQEGGVGLASILPAEFAPPEKHTEQADGVEGRHIVLVRDSVTGQASCMDGPDVALLWVEAEVHEQGPPLGQLGLRDVAPLQVRPGVCVAGGEQDPSQLPPPWKSIIRPSPPRPKYKRAAGVGAFELEVSHISGHEARAGASQDGLRCRGALRRAKRLEANGRPDGLLALSCN